MEPEEQAQEVTFNKAVLNRRSKFQKNMTVSIEEVVKPNVKDVDMDKVFATDELTVKPIEVIDCAQENLSPFKQV